MSDYKSAEYKGFSHAFSRILREEGFFRGLMKGYLIPLYGTCV